MKKIPPISFLALALLLAANDAAASKRPIRVDFGDWSPAQPIGTAACSGTTAGSTQVLWDGFVLAGSVDPKYLVDTYCQTSIAGEFDENSFSGEPSPALSRLIGLNTDNRVTAIRYTFLDRNRFDANKEGFQWVIYSFPGAKLIGFNASAAYVLDDTTFIATLESPEQHFWDGANNLPEEYLCYQRLAPPNQLLVRFSDLLLDSLDSFYPSYSFDPFSQYACVVALTTPFSNSFE